jgi:hypothetical protein
MSDLLNAAKFFFNQGIKEITLDVLKKAKDDFSGNRENLRLIDAVNISNKKLSHLIAKSWLPGAEAAEMKATLISEEQDKIRNLMVQAGVIENSEVEFFWFKVDPNPQPQAPPSAAFLGHMDDEGLPETSVKYIFNIPYPQKIESDWGLTEEQLRSWLATSPESEPWEPFQFSRWIPYTC